MDWKDRSHFYAIASKCMRQILIDYARKKLADKRGGDNQKITLIDNMVKQQKEASDLLDLDAALNKLQQLDERLAKLVECRYFGEMTIDDTAEALGISASTVRRDWEKARGWLHKELKSQS
jgi:RNA polymerase sigma factor (TIGR02999 family)